MKRAAFAFLLFAAVLPARAACDAECDEPTDWQRFSSITLEILEPGWRTRWQVRLDEEPGVDVAIDVEGAEEGKAPVRESYLLIGNRVMLAKGAPLEKGREIDVLDVPVLNVILVTRVLGREFPKGPASVGASARIDRTDKVGLRYATPSASGYLAPPWRATGTVKRIADRAMEFDLVISSPGDAKAFWPTGPTRAHVHGKLAMLGHPVLGDDMSLEGWTAFGVGALVEKRGSAKLLDYGARATDARFATVADVRAYIAEEYGPGKLDATRDFTGVWKEKCEQDFGLKILHHGDEGKYAVVFCGPGGCHDPAEQRLTFITGDREYEVVADDILLTGRSAKEKYFRCSRDVGEIRIVKQKPGYKP